MPVDIPGFYYDVEKNRYFKVHPGQSSGRAASGSHASSSRGGGGRRGRVEADDFQRGRAPENSSQRKKRRAFDGTSTAGSGQLSDARCNVASLLWAREVAGPSRVCSRGRGGRSFEKAFMEAEAGHTQVWEYTKAEGSGCTVPADKALLQLCTYGQTPEGAKQLSVLVSGDSVGSVSVWKPTAHMAADALDEWVLYPQLLGTRPRPRSLSLKSPGVPPLLDGRHPLNCALLDSAIVGVSLLNGGSGPQLPNPVAVITTMGGSSSGGVVRLLTFREDQAWGSYTFSNFDRTIWAAQSSPSAPSVALAASKGAVMVAYVDGRGLVINRQLCKSDSDALAVEFDNEGKTVLCGFRNGAISTIDIRKPSPRMNGSGGGEGHRQHTSPAAEGRRGGRTAQQRVFHGRSMKRTVDPMYCSHSPVMMMPSSITSIRTLPSNDNYVIAAAMDGSLWRWDRRFTQRPVLRYDGHVNSHTFLPCALDPSETLLFAGGEDSDMRVWSVSTGELLTSIPDLPGPITALGSLAIPEGRPEEAMSQAPSSWDEWWGRPASSGWDEWWGRRTHPWGLWLGSEEKLMYMCGGADAVSQQLTTF